MNEKAITDNFGDYISSRMDYDILKDFQRDFEEYALKTKNTSGKILIESFQLAHDNTNKKILDKLKMIVEPILTKDNTILELKVLIDTNLTKLKSKFTVSRIMLCFDGMMFLTDVNDKKKISDYPISNGCVVLFEVEIKE